MIYDDLSVGENLSHHLDEYQKNTKTFISTADADH